ncbi:MAG: short-chain dehydrogenase [Chromatiales bacterium 21-64-14]|nr:MAG: short-chain dehydrogenase [Chromatiales bacterium 21-64-14]HQU15982.1 SDR family NAD(P)-dependent oxidoreductase [Gammaproteobacteria bacterium]
MGGPRAVLITGCSSGIGQCAARGLAARGYRVFATARQAADVAALAATGLEALALDLDDPDSIQAATEEVLRRTAGAVYGVFHNGGYQQPGAVEDLSRAALRAQFETNVFGGLDVINRLLPAMRARGEGRVVINSSVLGLVALPYRGAYNATKFALEGLADTLRLELAGSGVHVSLIEPGPIRSQLRARAHAAFTTHIDIRRSAHRDAYRRLEARLARRGPAAPFTRPPEAVLAKLIQALERRRPKPRYYVTFPTHLFAVLRRLLSHRALDRVLLRIARGE